VRPWIDQLPERVRYELHEFDRLGLGFKHDELQLRAKKRLVLVGRVTHNGESVEVTVVYPDTYPYLRPQVYAPGLRLARHQNPYTGNLCLLDHSSRAWNTTDTGAWLIAKRLPHLLDLLTRGGDDLSANEAPQGEPLTSYFFAGGGTVVFVSPSALEIPAHVTGGQLRFGLGMPRPGVQLRAALLSVAGRSSNPPSKRWHTPAAPSALVNRFNAGKLVGSWVRLDTLPPKCDVEGLIECVRGIDPQAAEPRWQESAVGEISVLGVLVPDEVRHGETEDSWMFAVRLRASSETGSQKGSYLLRGERLSPESLQERTPGLRSFPAGSVALMGLGSIGGVLAMELARAQVGELRLLDMDSVETGNIVRWPFGLRAVGHAKAHYLASFIAAEYPFTKTVPVVHQVGSAMPQRPRGVPSEAKVLSMLVGGARLLIDATAEIGVSQLASELALRERIPLLSLWATEGGWGGAVAELVPGAPGCWYCLQSWLGDGSIQPPPAEPAGSVQPRGCGALTFTGTSFDMLEIVAQAMRSASRLLRASSTSSTVHVCAMRGADGLELPAPVWRTYAIAAHPRCPCCASAAAA
jgi:ThiF family/Prokaryotic E2 family B